MGLVDGGERVGSSIGRGKDYKQTVSNADDKNTEGQAAPVSDLTTYWLDYADVMIGGKERTEGDCLVLSGKAGSQHVITCRHELSAYAVIKAEVESTRLDISECPLFLEVKIESRLRR